MRLWIGAILVLALTTSATGAELSLSEIYATNDLQNQFAGAISGDTLVFRDSQPGIGSSVYQANVVSGIATQLAGTNFAKGRLDIDGDYVVFWDRVIDPNVVWERTKIVIHNLATATSIELVAPVDMDPIRYDYPVISGTGILYEESALIGTHG